MTPSTSSDDVGSKAAAIDVDKIIEELQARVAQRRADGDYPAGMEAELEAEFVAIMRATHRHETNTQVLERLIERVEESTLGLRAVAESGSRVPGGTALHATATRLVQRHTGTLAESVRSLGRDLVSALDEVRRLFDAQRSADERQLQDVVGSLLDRIAVLDHLADAVVDLETRVAALESGPQPFPAE
jgi:hypothetical protein